MSFNLSSKIRKGINEGNLKMIALVCMFIDHFTVVIVYSLIKYLENAQISSDIVELIRNFGAVLRAVGRVSFPIFAFMIAEGVLHTKSKVKYGLRLLILAFVSEVPFNMAINHSVSYLGQQNVFFTLLLGMIAISVSYELENLLKRNRIKRCFGTTLEALVIVISCLESYYIKADYGIIGVLTIVVIYFALSSNALKSAFYSTLGCMAVIVLNGIGGSYNTYYDYIIGCALTVIIDAWLLSPMIRDRKAKAIGAAALILCCGWISEIYAILAIPIVMCYNGERGKQNKLFFYLFYPVHLIVLTLLCMLLKLW